MKKLNMPSGFLRPVNFAPTDPSGKICKMAGTVFVSLSANGLLFV